MDLHDDPIALVGFDYRARKLAVDEKHPDLNTIGRAVLNLGEIKYIITCLIRRSGVERVREDVVRGIASEAWIQRRRSGRRASGSA